MNDLCERGCKQDIGDAVPVTDWIPGAPLPPELETGHRTLDFEHRQLLACMTATRQICLDIRQFDSCSGCIPARRRQCETELVRLLGDLLSFILDHFKTEEQIMRDSLLLALDREVCEAHIEDHAAISSAVQKLVSALDNQMTVQLLRELDDLLGRWITNHVLMHDMLLVRWVERHAAAQRVTQQL